MNHTPGPWILADGFARADMSRHFVWSDAESREDREDGNLYCIAIVNPRTDTAQMDANAKLIAAAPDLLVALIEAERMIDAMVRNNPMPDDLEALKRIRTTLSKAGLR